MRRQGRRPLQNTSGSGGGGRYIKRGQAKGVAGTESGRRRCRRPLRKAGGCYRKPAAAVARGRSGRKKSGQGALPDGETFLGCRKVGFWFPLARKKQGIHFSTPEAGLSGQKTIKHTQKHSRFGCFRAFPQNFKISVRQKYYRCGPLLRRQERGNYVLWACGFSAPGLQSIVIFLIMAPTCILNHFWIQVAVSEVKRPLRNRFGSETVIIQIYNGYISDFNSS